MSKSMKQKPKLDKKAIRKMSKSVPGCQEWKVPSDEPQVISFMTGLGDVESKDGPARVDIYLDTGTVATGRILNGQVRQVFRRNVLTTDMVQQLLKEPPTLTSIDAGLVIGEPASPARVTDEGEIVSPDDSEPELRTKMELAEVGICILMGEKERLESHLESLKQETDSATDNESEMDVPGIEFEFSLPEDSMKHVDHCLQDIQKQDKPVTCVATNGRGTIFLYGNGGVAFTPNIPKALYNKLKQMKGAASSFGNRPCYVSLGSRDRFYIGFNDGTADWKGPKAFEKCMRKLINPSNTSKQKQGKRRSSGKQSKPRSVAFGSTFDSFFVVFNDGSWEYNGRAIPDELKDKLADRSDRPDLVCVSLGPKGEWFLKAENGRMWWGGITEALDILIQGLLESERFLSFIDFGEDGTFFVSYD